MIDEHKISRGKAVLIIGAITTALGIPAALSLGAVPALSSIAGGKGFLDIMDFLFGNVSLTFGALMTCVFLVYRWGIYNAATEVKEGCPTFGKYVLFWRIFLGYVAPAAIATMLVYILVTGQGLG